MPGMLYWSSIEEDRVRNELAADGMEGLQMYRAHTEVIDTLLLNLFMPKMSGQEAFLEIMRIDREAKVVVFSGLETD